MYKSVTYEEAFIKLIKILPPGKGFRKRFGHALLCGFSLFRRLFYWMCCMKYYLHDTSSFDDEKITELYLKFGYEGLGLFYTLLEKIARQEKPIRTSVLKAQLNVGKHLEKHWKFMEEIGIISSTNGDTFNERLLNFAQSYEIKKEKTRKKVSEWRDKQRDAKSVTGYETVSNPPKVKLSKVNKEKEEEKEVFISESEIQIEKEREEFLARLMEEEID